MPQTLPNISLCVSILDRLTQMYYNRNLTDTAIGWGQQFYLEYIYHHPATTAQAMVDVMRVDKATLTKNIKLLWELGYLKIEVDEQDKRVRHLYLTPPAVAVVEKIKAVHEAFFQDLTTKLSAKAIQQTEQTLAKMITNINGKVWHRMSPKN